jgi:hypothetical protein
MTMRAYIWAHVFGIAVWGVLLGLIWEVTSWL